MARLRSELSHAVSTVRGMKSGGRVNLPGHDAMMASRPALRPPVLFVSSSAGTGRCGEAGTVRRVASLRARTGACSLAVFSLHAGRCAWQCTSRQVPRCMVGCVNAWTSSATRVVGKDSTILEAALVSLAVRSRARRFRRPLCWQCSSRGGFCAAIQRWRCSRRRQGWSRRAGWRRLPQIVSGWPST